MTGILLSFTFVFYLLIYWAWLALMMMMMSVVYGMGSCFSSHQIANQIGQGWVLLWYFFLHEYGSHQYGPKLAGNK
jgi:hypothetical protein